MFKIAILGYGVVGSGVLEVIETNANSIAQRAGKKITVKNIVDIREFHGDKYEKLFTKNAEKVFMDPEIKIVVETIGGTSVAYTFTKKALSCGKHVVTSNKELVAKHGPELLKMARDNNVNYLFEASVGGGIPIIRPLNSSLSAENITEITGILNGTTNYILTQMGKNELSLKEALREAQEKGYAEADPTADIEGYDVQRKIAILSSIAYKEYVNCEQIKTKGIADITIDDINFAKKLGAKIKLIGRSKKMKDGIFVKVVPMMLDINHPLANVSDVFNAIMVKGNAIGETMFYGKGAGKLPTASAVVSDIIDIARYENESTWLSWEHNNGENLISSLNENAAVYICFKTSDIDIAKQKAIKIFGIKNFYYDNKKDIAALITEKYDEKELKNKIEKFKEYDEIISLLNVIQVL